MTASEVQKNLDNHTQVIENLNSALKILEQVDENSKQGTSDHKLVLKRLLIMFQLAQSIQELRIKEESLPSKSEKTLFIKLCEFAHLDKVLFTPTGAVPGICTLLHASMIISVWVGLAAILLRMIAFLSVQINECKQQDKEFLKQQVSQLIKGLTKEGIQMPQLPSNISAALQGAVYLSTAAALNDSPLEKQIEALTVSLQQEKLEKEELKQQLQSLMESHQQTLSLLNQILVNTNAIKNQSNISSPPTNPSNTNQPPPTEQNQTA